MYLGGRCGHLVIVGSMSTLSIKKEKEMKQYNMKT